MKAVSRHVNEVSTVARNICRFCTLCRARDCSNSCRVELSHAGLCFWRTIICIFVGEGKSYEVQICSTWWLLVMCLVQWIIFQLNVSMKLCSPFFFPLMLAHCCLVNTDVCCREVSGSEKGAISHPLLSILLLLFIIFTAPQCVLGIFWNHQNNFMLLIILQ